MIAGIWNLQLYLTIVPAQCGWNTGLNTCCWATVCGYSHTTPSTLCGELQWAGPGDQWCNRGSANQQPSRMRHCSKCNARHEAPTGKRCQAHSTRRGSRKATSSPQGEDGATSLEATLVALSTQMAALNSRMDSWEGNKTTPQESEVGQTLSHFWYIEIKVFS